ncbi:MAG: 2Fe-2S iron-sulfur cluster-binding protein [Candidatus Aminicenantes bacterium]|nr:2Fe-2S iron-sulfur cluster-binding protein [Candidatus Aminicenantes bacterium]
MIRIYFDGRPVWAREGATVLDAAKAAGIRIPHLCRHASLPPEGSCRICLVAVEGLPKLELACSTVVREEMKIATSSPSVREARRAVLELLLTEHPLDCPICDKAGECKLQNYAHEYGLTAGPFAEEQLRRDKLVPLGAGLILDRERCVLCTRCVRFLAAITGTRELGLFERGVRAEIGLYDDRPVASVDAGNLVDLCPVGAITDARFRFRTRPWFLEARPTICPFCARGCAMDADFHPGFARRPESSGIFRFRPRVNPEINGWWLCDRGRHESMGLVKNRLHGGREAADWKRLIADLAERLREMKTTGKQKEIAVLLSSRLTAEELFLASALFRAGLGVERFAFLDPREGAAEGLLLRPDRSANARGADRLGFDRSVDPAAAVTGSSLLIALAADPAGIAAWREPGVALAAIRTKILIAPQPTGLEEAFDLVLPSAGVFEKSGTFVSEGDRVQAFEPVHPPCPDVRSESWILASLGTALDLDAAVFSRPDDPSFAAAAMRAAHPDLGGGR